MATTKKIDWQVVDEMLMADCEGTEIAPVFGISPKTLYRRCKERYGKPFGQYLAEKKSCGNGNIKMAQYESAVEDRNTSMLIWLGKQRLNQTDKKDATSAGEAIPNITVQAFDDETQELIRKTMEGK